MRRGSGGDECVVSATTGYSAAGRCTPATISAPPNKNLYGQLEKSFSSSPRRARKSLRMMLPRTGISLSPKKRARRPTTIMMIPVTICTFVSLVAVGARAVSIRYGGAPTGNLNQMPSSAYEIDTSRRIQPKRRRLFRIPMEIGTRLVRGCANR